MRMRDGTRPALGLLYLLYVAFMVMLLFLQRIGEVSYEAYACRLWENVNMIPFRTTVAYLRQAMGAPASGLLHPSYVNLVGNTILFMPTGLILPLLHPRYRRPGTLVGISLAALCGVELIQWVTLLGVCDIDDVLLNLLGILMGYGCYRLYAGRSRRSA